MRWTIPLFLLACRLAAMETGLVTGTLSWEDRDRGWLAYVPPTAAADPHRPRPILLVLHGGGGDGQGMRGMTFAAFEPIADLHDLVVVYPDGWEKGWNDDRTEVPEPAEQLDVDDVGFLRALTDEVAARWNGDLHRVFVTGMSNGAIMSYRLAREMDDRVAGIAPVAGFLPTKATPYALNRPVPLMLVAGTADPLVPYAGGPITLPAILGGGTRDTVLGAEATAGTFAAINGLGPVTLTVPLPDTDQDDGTTTDRILRPDNAAGTAVELYRVEGGGHTWPQGYAYQAEWLIGKVAQDWNACAFIWAFFSAKGRPAPERRTVTITSDAGVDWRCTPGAPYSAPVIDGRVFCQLATGGDATLVPLVAIDN